LREENRDQLRAIIELHVFPARVYSDQALAAGAAQSLGGETVNFGLSASELQVNGVSIVAADLEASNGVIHVIDEVLLPRQRVASAGGPNSLIRLAIERGVPLFNRGDADACAAVYEVAMRALVDLTDLPQLTRADFVRTLAQADGMRDPVARAWAYREAFDRALNVMVAAAE
jgi:hypothetical protein